MKAGRRKERKKERKKKVRKKGRKKERKKEREREKERVCILAFDFRHANCVFSLHTRIFLFGLSASSIFFNLTS